MRLCNKCGIIKPISEYYTHNGKIGKCKECEKKWAIEWTKNNKDKAAISYKKYVSKNKDKLKEKHKRWWNNLSEEQKILYRKRRIITPEQSRKNYLKIRNKYKSLYGISYATANIFGLKLILDIYKKYNNKCCLCNNDKGLCVHHKDGIGFGNYKKKNKPVNNKLDNLLLVCRKCHMLIHKNLPCLRK